ncbi:gamma-glutamyl-gamma-aminobutyrate hydrolase family protein [Fimbriiglobus ruber]|uniref:gamma-glutamyl-gamma-aminobutyrate hydrolase n=1 Tax=Fimbriiglobus ruber TaxID=1908690 RepID=A0A225DS28_9BACT|nr:gamma-glutamyl-gamma-aminobutyrate hydrolase family protein [Fimbriiglobus ruber]OWK40406.1 Para-aminobenzoate synthase, amidotransferase component [Fimbriiglobus ruber]
MGRPVIGLITQTLAEVSGERSACWMMGYKYVEALRAVGAVPWIIPSLQDDSAGLEEIFARLDGVFLVGGADIDPDRYGEPKSAACGPTDPARDDVEIAAIHHAAGRGLPVLAVCRGIQILNVALGGTLYQDIATEVPAALKHDYFTTPSHTDRTYLAHEAAISSGSRLADILGESVVPVNSLHHQAIKHLADGLRATGFSPDGIIEGVEGTGDQFLIGAQWHPEELIRTQPCMRRLFASFVSAAGG